MKSEVMKINLFLKEVLYSKNVTKISKKIEMVSKSTVYFELLEYSR